MAIVEEIAGSGHVRLLRYRVKIATEARAQVSRKVDVWFQIKTSND